MANASEIVTVCNQKGLHARAAAKVVVLAQQFQSDIRIKRYHAPAQASLISELSEEEIEANARSILGLMVLGAAKGTQLEIVAKGEDAQPAVEALKQLIEARFEEEH